MFEDKDPLKLRMKWSPFLLIFPELQGFKEYLLQNIDVIREANAVIDTIQTEEQLLEWLMKYEEIGTEAPHGLKYSFRQKDDHFWWNYYNPIFFKDDIFTDAKHFINFFLKNHEEMFEKYSTYTDEEISISYNMCDSKEETKNLYSLKFHLENRKNLEEIGIHVPLYIDRNDDNT